jgi:hypothetical protein
VEPYALTRAEPQAAIARHALPSRNGVPGLAAVSALRPDVGLLHVPYADPATRTAWGYGVGPDLMLAAACRRLHVSYDVATSAPPPLPNRFAVPPHLIHRLEHRPLGAFPSACWPLYGPYAPFYAEYAERARQEDAPVPSAIAEADLEFVRRALRHDAGAILGFDGPPASAVHDHRRELERWLGRTS